MLSYILLKCPILTWRSYMIIGHFTGFYQKHLSKILKLIAGFLLPLQHSLIDWIVFNASFTTIVSFLGGQFLLVAKSKVHKRQHKRPIALRLQNWKTDNRLQNCKTDNRRMSLAYLQVWTQKLSVIRLLIQHFTYLDNSATDWLSGYWYNILPT